MILHTLWGARKGESTPELMVAWDEYSVDENRLGFDDECTRATKSIIDLDEKRWIDIEVSEDALMRAFNTSRIGGTVLSSASTTRSAA